MLKFNRISPRTDFYSKLDILNKNLLYVTHMQDKILKLLKTITVDKNLQNTVDEFFEEDETSPQTDTETTKGAVGVDL